MYFVDRHTAGIALAAQMSAYHGADVVIIALSDGAVLVGRAMAEAMQARLTLLLTRPIMLPGENAVIGSVDEGGGFTYNNMFSTGQIEEYAGEFRNYIEAQKMEAISEIHAVLGKHGEHDRHQLQDKVLILVSDVVSDGVSFDAALNYLKPVRWKRLVTVAPVATIAAIDRMHVIADEIHVLLPVETIIGLDHYFQQNQIPANDALMNMLDSLDDGTNLAQEPKRSYT